MNPAVPMMVPGWVGAAIAVGAMDSF